MSGLSLSISSSYSPAASDSEKEQYIASCFQTEVMSRRSLRLNDSLLDRTLAPSSASLSVGGAGWMSTRSSKSRRSQQLSVSCSESLLVHTPRKQLIYSLHNSSVHSVASDASLISSLLDESSIQETTLVDTLWGLDQDADPRESTVIAEQSTVLTDRTLIGPHDSCQRHPPHTLSKVYCKDCEDQQDRKEPAHPPSSRYTSSSSCMEPPGPDSSVIYSRDRSRKNRSGVLVSVWDRSAACVFSLLSLLLHHLTPHRRKHVTDVLRPWLDASLLCVRRAAARCVCVLTHTWQVCRGLCLKLSQVDTQIDDGLRAGPSHRGVMTLKESTVNQEETHPNGSLCKSAAQVCTWLSKRWRHMNTSFLLTRFPLRLLLLLPLLLLLFSLCWFGPAALRSVLPSVNVTELSAVLHDMPSINSLLPSNSRPGEGAEEEEEEAVREVQLYQEVLYREAPPADAERGEQDSSSAAAVGELERLARLEQSLVALWERVEAGGRQAEQRHREVLQLYADLQQQGASAPSGGEDGGWLNGLLEEQLDTIKTQLEEERRSREQTQQQDLFQLQRESTRLDELERQLKSLTATTQEVQSRQEAALIGSPSPALPAAVSVAVDRQSHDALLAEVARLEAVLEDVRRDVKSLSGCGDGCRELDRIQQTVSSQVREEVRALVYGNQPVLRGGASADLPGSLLQWLSQQYVSRADLQGALASLELSILQNISLQLEQGLSDQAVRETVLHATGEAGAAVTEEDVQLIVKNALRLFSQDRTGLADYALESGGGSVLSTRCSETYETKAALLSLFGIPLWYFSQSPRVVIQPDVHPGNCWAFRGSTGFLVIRLSMRILPTAFSLEHIPKTLAPSGTLHSAPRDFSVYGLDDDAQEKGKLLGKYTYDEDGESLQMFEVTEENQLMFQIIEVQVLSNWGHEEYTCLYRFRVHGTPADD
ncbi:SUN domain-containing protein 1-like [Halichoeres trimaculatus]|uniref:SUN domain-containing protein 1-like n=1 Tax=Halichoeres trimaculatus TaxID=147232 RepID=UPI003D9EB452